MKYCLNKLSPVVFLGAPLNATSALIIKRNSLKRVNLKYSGNILELMILL